ncbi:topoisomerase DNA-binding C4 zinc finger domain-containing protein [Ammoniphilus resinae]|uniref:topoisomerase DNA-binding C4 zinc finger domain-containing protein n=1 Tax=Ammoniphilus resinae TaxID=861532 RepID=UPI001FD747FF|nr:topoisomerase DNA-binding C4 zinc finger domain-containing protein [Ammoniphilus resinae]
MKIEVQSLVTDFTKLVSVIQSHRDIQLTNQQMRMSFEQIQNNNILDPEARKLHIHQIKKGIAERNQSVLNGICPKCSSLLVDRKGKYGNFKGCSNFPTCRFKIKGETPR